MAVLVVLYDIDPQAVHLYNLASFTDLINSGVSDDEDMRVFEIGWKGPNVSAWAEHPLFLTDDTSLLEKWAELFADIARTRRLRPSKARVREHGRWAHSTRRSARHRSWRPHVRSINDAALRFPDGHSLTI
jgi:hypothetical protein